MKRFPFFLLVAVVFAAGFLTAAAARAAITPDTPEGAIRSFYAWYVPALEGGGDVLETGRAELRRRVSGRFLKEIDRTRKSPDGLGADPFLSAQDFDAQWAKRVTVREVRIQGETATAEVTLTGKELGAHRLRVSLVREDGVWELDRVAGPG